MYRSLQDNDSIEQLDISCLLPNGMFISLNICPDFTLNQLKNELWIEAEKLPLGRFLDDKSVYMFLGMNPNVQELDENEKLSDMKLLFGEYYAIVLKVVEKPMEADKLNLQRDISKLLDKDYCAKFDESDEIIDLRDKAASYRRNDPIPTDPLEKIEYFFPPRVEGESSLFKKFLEQSNRKSFEIKVHFCTALHKTAGKLYSFVIENDTVNKFIKKIVQRNPEPMEIFKVCGQEQYIFGDHRLSSFHYIREKIMKDEIPEVIFLSADNVSFNVHNVRNLVGEWENGDRRPSVNNDRRQISSWNVNKNYECVVELIVGIETYCGYQLEIHAGLYHGNAIICPRIKIGKEITTLNCRSLDVWLKFDIKIANLPRATKLCLGLCKIDGSTKIPIGWVNMMVFDFKGVLVTGGVKGCVLPLNSIKFSNDEDILMPLKTVEESLDKDHSILLKFPDPSRCIKYPNVEFLIKDLINKNPMEVLANREDATSQRIDLMESYKKRSRNLLDQSLNISDKFTELGITEDVLTRIIKETDWTDQKNVSEITLLLVTSDIVSVDKALMYLDPLFADPQVRNLAVRSLKVLRDEDLILLMLHLVQALKSESYINCALTQFLLERAISNKQFGNCFFWYLRSEFDDPKAKNRFSIILEIFLRNSRIQVQCLIKQQSCFKKLERAVEKGEAMTHEVYEEALFKFLEPDKDAFADFYNPINLYEKSKSLKCSKCKPFKSKTRPILTICENVDRFGSDINFIFKSGDDLRQDLFTLQILRVMDMIWKSYGLDFQMTNYGCLSTGPNTGLIETVQQAETIAKIQRKHGLTGSFKLVLLTWLKDKNKNDKLKSAIKNFTFSAVGYCVATYILGVADRHSDNIMIKENGLMFHIDFGHILGNFKRKFGIKRENVPFILTHDFVDIINNGEKGITTANFLIFKKICAEAYEIIRENKDLILTLFTSAISAGMPEVKLDDLEYLKYTLALNKTKEEANADFEKRFNEALANDYKTSWNFFFHNVKQ